MNLDLPDMMLLGSKAVQAALGELGAQPAPDLIERVWKKVNEHDGSGANHFASELLHWYLCGRQRYRLAPRLVEKFQFTRVADVPIGEIKLPFDSFYLRFKEPIELLGHDPKWPRVHKLITREAEGLFFAENQIFALFYPVKDSPAWFFEITSPSIALDFSDPNLSIAKLMEASREGKLSAGRKLECEDLAAALIEWEDRAAPTILNLFVNSLLFITHCRHWIREEWPDIRPALLEKARNGSVKAQQQMAKLRARKIFVCDLPAEKAEPTKPGKPTGRKVEPHWRTGFWRRQAFGIALSQRRLKWIQPVYVNGEDGPAGPGPVREVNPE